MGFVRGSETFQKKDDSNSKNNIRGFVVTVNAPAITDEQAKRAMRQMHEDLKSRRKAREVAHIKSMEAAKEFYSDWYIPLQL